MATITMDTSEYEALQKNIQLLEEAKRKESRLYEDIKKLQKEKIQAFIDAKQGISVITKNITEEVIYTKRANTDIMKGIDLLIHNYRNHNYSIPVDSLIEAFFEKSKNIKETDVSITTRGLDEVKKELKKEAQKEARLEVSYKLEKLQQLEDKQIEFNKNKEALQIEVAKMENIQEEIFGLKKDCEKSKMSFSKKSLDYECLASEIKTLLYKTGSWNIFNYLVKYKTLENIYNRNVTGNKY